MLCMFQEHQEKQCELLLMEQQLAEVEETGGITIPQTQFHAATHDTLSQVGVEHVLAGKYSPNIMASTCIFKTPLVGKSKSWG